MAASNISSVLLFVLYYEVIKTDTTSLVDSNKTNEWILVKAGVTRTLIASIKTTKLRYFGHIMRHNCIDKKLS